jgi:nicotinamide N-methyltransferase
VVLTDYPDQALVDNLAHNIVQNVEPARRGAVSVLGYIWGHPVDPLLRALLPDPSHAGAEAGDDSPDARSGPSFDLILLSDLIFNHSQVRHHQPFFSSSFVPSTRFNIYVGGWVWLPFLGLLGYEKHRALLATCEHATAPGGCVLVFYTHHRPHLAHRDMEFFEVAREMGWKCEKLLTERFPVRVSVISKSRASLIQSFVIDGHHLFLSADVSRGLGRGRGAVNCAWVEAHASVTPRNISIATERTQSSS